MNDEVKFARSLAHPEKSVRDKTLKTLQHYLGNVTAIPDLEMAQLWKALYYCMWLCDKTQIQMELADSLSSLLDVFSKYSLSMKYLRCFFRIMLREWTQLDQYRINKFYSLIRLMLHKAFAMLREKGMKAKNIDQFLEVLQEEALSKTPNGIRFHICDIYLEEMYAAFGGSLARKVFFQLLQPFLNSLANADDSVYHERIAKKIVLAFIDQTSEKPWNAITALHMQEIVFSIASDEQTSNRYRKRLYELHTAYQQHTGQQYAQPSSDSDTLEELSSASNGDSQAKKNKKSKKRAAEDSAKPEESSTTTTPEPKKKKPKAVPVPEPTCDATLEPEQKNEKNKVPVKNSMATPEKATSAEEAPAFVSSKKFAGAKPGYVFKQGPSGLGYYKDTKTPVKSIRFDKVYKKSHAVSVRDLKSAELDLSKKPTKSAIKASSSSFSSGSSAAGININAVWLTSIGKKHSKKR